MYAGVAFVIEHSKIQIKLIPLMSSRSLTLEDWLALIHKPVIGLLSNQAVPIAMAVCMRSQWKKWMHKQRSNKQHVILEKLYKWAVGYTESIKVNWIRCSDSLTLFHKYTHTSIIEEWHSVIKPIMLGRKLHTTELQRLLQQHLQKQLTLQDVFERVAVWSWYGFLEVYNGLQCKKSTLTGRYEHCQRCFAKKLEKHPWCCESCGVNCWYCPQCTMMGKIRSCTILLYANVKQQSVYYSSQTKDTNQLRPQITAHDIHALLQQRSLSDAQKEASLSVIQYFYKQQEMSRKGIRLTNHQINKFLIWAVTGAGKTEMIFPIIDYFAALQSRILIATPRRDVVLELSPRIRKAFPHLKVVSLYGGSADIWEAGDLYIATTHQVMRFYRCFDFIIIDEMDAFPYHGDETLHRVLQHAHRPSSYQVLLTATPPRKERIQLKLKQLPHVKVPVRYHKHPLPVPSIQKSMTVKEMLEKQRVSSSLLDTINRSFKRGAVLFIFVQRIAQLQPLKDLLALHLPQIKMAQTSSVDDERANKVSSFRNREFDVLLTTSILERGVTVHKSDVCIIDADQPLFDRTAIIQMAGRAGRSSEDPNGFVTLLSKQVSSEMKAAIKQIKLMNRLARKKGYFSGG